MMFLVVALEQKDKALAVHIDRHQARSIMEVVRTYEQTELPLWLRYLAVRWDGVVGITSPTDHRVVIAREVDMTELSDEVTLCTNDEAVWWEIDGPRGIWRSYCVPVLAIMEIAAGRFDDATYEVIRRN